MPRQPSTPPEEDGRPPWEYLPEGPERECARHLFPNYAPVEGQPTYPILMDRLILSAKV